MARVELSPLDRLEVRAARVHETDRAIDFSRQGLVPGVGRVGHEPLVPLVDEAEIRETTGREGPNQVQRRCGRVVTAQHAIRVVPPRFLGEIEAIDHFATERRQRDVPACL